jgi:hypothetical protein
MHEWRQQVERSPRRTRASLSGETPRAGVETSTEAEQRVLSSQTHARVEIFKGHIFHLDIDRGRGAPFGQTRGDVTEIGNGSLLIVAKNG